jgi:hypothetical protein
MTEAHLKKLLLTVVVAYERTYLDATILMTLLSQRPPWPEATRLLKIKKQMRGVYRSPMLAQGTDQKDKRPPPVTSGRSMMNVG